MSTNGAISGTSYPRVTLKSQRMYGFLVVAWMAVLGAVGMEAFQVSFSEATVLEVVGLWLNGLFIAICTLFGLWHSSVVFTRALAARSTDFHGHSELSLPTAPQVAVLYTTCDDFQPLAAASCVELDYPAFHVFLLDDSGAAQQRCRIDAFHAQHPDTTTIVRRGDRIHFKAGNINNFLSHHSGGFEYVLLADADEQLPPDFLKRVIPAMSGSVIAFVQARHVTQTDLGHPFVRDFHHIIDIMWEYYQSYRNRFGLVPCLGHGVLIRVEALRQIGGFPRVVSEDLAFTIQARVEGLVGHFSEAAIAREGFPDDYRSYRKRLYRWVTADCECLVRCATPFMRKTFVPWFERLDLLLREARLPLVSLVLPMVFANLLFFDSNDWYDLRSSRALAVFCALAPFLCFAARFLKQPIAGLRFAAHSTGLYLSLSGVTWLGAMTFLAKGRAHFTATGNRESAASGSAPNCWPVYCVEGIAGTSLLGAALTASDLLLLGLATALLLAPLFSIISWKHRTPRALAYIPFCLMAAGTVANVGWGAGEPASLAVVFGLSLLLFC